MNLSEVRETVCITCVKGQTDGLDQGVKVEGLLGLDEGNVVDAAVLLDTARLQLQPDKRTTILH